MYRQDLNNEWISYSSDRWSSHPSVGSINLRGKHEGNVYGGIAGKSIDQYEVNMGHNRYGSTFSMLCGTYEWRDPNSYTEPTKVHTGNMLDPKKFKSLGVENDNTDRDYLVTWFQFEQYAANTHNPDEGIIKKGIDTFSHCLDWASYKWTKKNIGPFGTSPYTENPWKPLYIHCCPRVCYSRSISKGKHNKSKIEGVNYSSGKICQESVNFLKQKFGLDKSDWMNKQKVLDIIMEKYYCYANAMPCHSDQMLYKGKKVGSCGAASVQSILEENSPIPHSVSSSDNNAKPTTAFQPENPALLSFSLGNFSGGKKKHSKMKTTRRFSRNRRKTRRRKNKKSKHTRTRKHSHS